MTWGLAPISQNLGICPVDGTAANVEALVDKQIAYEKERYQKWVAEYRYQSNQLLAMATLSQLAQQYFADKALEASKDAAEKQWNIANRQMEIAEAEYERYKERFFCNEHNMAAEACEPFEGDPQYEIAAIRATRNARISFAPQYRAYQRARSRYCMCDDLADFCDLDKEEALATVAARNFAFEAEDVRANRRREYYDNFRQNVANFGREIQTTQLNTYAGAMPTAVAATNLVANARRERYATWAGGINNVLSAYFSPRIAAPQVYSGGYGAGGFFGSMGTSQAVTPYSGMSQNVNPLMSAGLY